MSSNLDFGKFLGEEINADLMLLGSDRMCSTVYRPQVHLIAAKDAIKKAMTVYDNVVCPLSISLRL